VIGLGLLMILAGAAVMARGAPYYMLEWGVAYLAAGAIAVGTGLTLAVMGVVLRRLGAIERRIEGLSLSRAEPPLETAGHPSFTREAAIGPGERGPAVIGALGAASAVGAMALSTTTPTEAQPSADAAGVDAAAAFPDAGPEDGATTALAETARGILSSVSPADATTAPGTDAGADSGDVAPPALLSGPADAADPFERINRALRDLKAGALGDDLEPEGRTPPTMGGDAPAADASALPETPAAAASLETFAAPEPIVETAAPARDETDVEAAFGSVLSLNPDRVRIGWGPSAELDDLREHLSTDERAITSGTISEMVAEPAPDTAQAEPEQPAGQSDAASPVSPEASADQPAAVEPTASDDGVVAAYTVGDSAFTMYADGRIVADTPEGRYSFASMDELRTFMAARRA
jgi:hypothetical protein